MMTVIYKTRLTLVVMNSCACRWKIINTSGCFTIANIVKIKVSGATGVFIITWKRT